MRYVWKIAGAAPAPASSVEEPAFTGDGAFILINDYAVDALTNIYRFRTAR